ncbi:uncharacterized protein METZ01_LOCUS426533, partial [marine metagenome]
MKNALENPTSVGFFVCIAKIVPTAPTKYCFA